MKLRIFYYLFLAVISLSCLDKVTVPIRQETEKLVVEGGISNDSTAYSVKLSLTRQFGNSFEISPVRGALLTISDNLSSVILRASPLEAGVYRVPSKQLIGRPGQIYTLNIKLPDGREYVSSPEKMPLPVPIAKVYAQFNGGTNTGYQVFVDVKDPASAENFYRWTAFSIYKRKTTGIAVGFGGRCCDVCWIRTTNNEPNLFSDANVNGGLLQKRPVIFSPVFAFTPHHIEVTQQSLTREAYQFWKRYQEQFTRTGSIFDPTPAPILGNVVNKSQVDDIALGYFSASSVSRSRVVIPDTLAGKIIINPLYIPEGDCARVYSFGVYDLYPPPGW